MGFHSHQTDDCIEGPMDTQTHKRVPGYKVFCMGSKDNIIYYEIGKGCFADASCDYFMSAKVVTNPTYKVDSQHMQWNLFSNAKMFFMLSKEVMDIPRNLDIRGITVLNTSAYPGPEFASWTWKETGSRIGSFGNQYKLYTFEKDFGGEVPYEEKAIMAVGNFPGAPKKKVVYNRVSVTTWNQGQDYLGETWVPNAMIQPLIPYFISVENLSGTPVVTVLSPKKPINLFNDNVAEILNINEIADYFYLGDGDVTTTTTTTTTPEPMTTTTEESTEATASDTTNKSDDSGSMGYIWAIIGVVIVIVIVLIVIFVVLPNRKSVAASTQSSPEESPLPSNSFTRSHINA